MITTFITLFKMISQTLIPLVATFTPLFKIISQTLIPLVATFTPLFKMISQISIPLVATFTPLFKMISQISIPLVATFTPLCYITYMKIGIIGLGLIGGSIFKDLRKLNYDVVAVSKSQDGEGIYKSYDVLKDCHLVFVCSAMNKTIEILDDLESVLSPETIVTDVCSLKRFVCTKQRPYKFIPSHPMAGTEHKGYENSFEGLFKGAKWVVTPVYGEDDRLIEIIEILGAKPVITTPDKHDEAAALISHMPMVIAQAIFKTAQDNDLALEIAASGFRDMTRLAMSNPEMANDMIQMNSENIQMGILKLYKTIGDLTNSNYLEQINEIKLNRQSMF